MSLVLGAHTAIDNLIQISLAAEYYKLKWVPNSEITDIKASQIDTVSYAIYKQTLDNYETRIVLSLLGSGEVRQHL